jgi:hypothetical protein
MINELVNHLWATVRGRLDNLHNFLFNRKIAIMVIVCLGFWFWASGFVIFA